MSAKTTTPSLDARLIPLIDEMLDGDLTLPQVTEAFERKYIDRALTKTKGCVTRASKKLGVHRNTLHVKLRKYVPVAAQPIVGAKHHVKPRPQKCTFCPHMKSVHKDHLCCHRDPVTRELDCACTGVRPMASEDGEIR